MTLRDHCLDQPDQVYCYNLDHTTTPGRMKVRWKIRIATGAESQRLDIAQQKAIIGLLNWADKHSNHAGKHPPAKLEISRE